MPTVSRALNDAPDIGRDTKRLVRKIADEIGYVPNRAGVRLRTGRTNVISLIMSTDHSNHTGKMIASLAGGLNETPYHLIMTPFFPTEDPMKPVRYIVETGSADAIILNQIEPEDQRVAYLMERNFPFVTHGRSQWSNRHAFYDFDNEAYGRIAADNLFKRKRTNILMIGPPQKHSYGQHMNNGVDAATSANNQRLIKAEVVDSDMLSASTLPYIQRMLTENPEIDGIITGSTNAATAAVGAIERSGRRLGTDIDVYTKEAEAYLGLLRPEILSCYEGIGEGGAFLARAAIQAIKNPKLPPMQHLEVPKI